MSEKHYQLTAGDLILEVYAIGSLIQGGAYLKTVMHNNAGKIRLANLQSLHDLRYIADSMIRQIGNSDSKSLILNNERQLQEEISTCYSNINRITHVLKNLVAETAGEEDHNNERLVEACDLLKELDES